MVRGKQPAESIGGKGMGEGGIRIGTVSSVDAGTGMVSIIYGDRDGEVTDLLPYATFNDEYKLPRIGAKVVVLHLSNGKEMGVVLGTYWNESNVAGASGEYHKALGDGAYFDYTGGTFTIAASHIRLVSANDGIDITLAGLLKDIRDIKGALGIG